MVTSLEIFFGFLIDGADRLSNAFRSATLLEVIETAGIEQFVRIAAGVGDKDWPVFRVLVLDGRDKIRSFNVAEPLIHHDDVRR